MARVMARVVCEGEDSPETRRMRDFMGDSKSHGTYGVSIRWRNAKGLVPKRVDGEVFEE